MRILAIGNSFSEDATRYLSALARADGEDAQVANLYIGGCSLEQHYRNLLSGRASYELQYNGQKPGFFVSLHEAICNREWDVVTLQQVSHLSFQKESYEPYCSTLMDFVRTCVPKARVYLHQTWAYEEGSARLSEVAHYESAERMKTDIVRAYGDIAEAVRADGVIRSGELFGMLSNSGITGLYRDGFHASLGLGRYALGLLWYRTLFGKAARHNSFRDFDEPISEDTVQAVQAVVDSIS